MISQNYSIHSAAVGTVVPTISTKSQHKKISPRNSLSPGLLWPFSSTFVFPLQLRSPPSAWPGCWRVLGRVVKTMLKNQVLICLNVCPWWLFLFGVFFFNHYIFISTLLVNTQVTTSVLARGKPKFTNRNINCCICHSFLLVYLTKTDHELMVKTGRKFWRKNRWPKNCSVWNSQMFKHYMLVDCL